MRNARIRNVSLFALVIGSLNISSLVWPEELMAQGGWILSITTKDNNVVRGDKIGNISLGHSSTGWYLRIDGSAVDETKLNPVHRCVIFSTDRAAVVDLHQSLLAAMPGNGELRCHNAERMKGGIREAVKVDLDDRRLSSAQLEIVVN